MERDHDGICLAYFDWAQYNPILRDYLIHIPNEGKRTLMAGRKLRLSGLRRGVPDYHLPWPNDKWHGLWIEVKTLADKGRLPSIHQRQWIGKLQAIGHYATFAYGLDALMQITTDYLNNKI